MRAVLQRVSEARVSVGEEVLGRIASGSVVLLGVAEGDTDADASWMADQIAGLRVFADPDGKMNLDVGQVGGAVLLISQFTLLADTRRGRRPSFTGAAAPAEGERLYEAVADALRSTGVTVECGRFGAHMAVELTNDGPVTVILDSVDRTSPRRS
jgi:D-tyrosyl-tRNA(Tyr) deacylase